MLERGTSRIDAVAHGFGERHQSLGTSLSDSARREWESLQSESDPELRDRGLLQLAGRQAASGSENAALQILSLLQDQSDISPDLRRQAQRDLAALTGTGATLGARAEVLLRRFAGEASNPSALLAMSAAGAVFRLTRFGVMARLAGSGPGIWTRGPLASGIASSLGFLAEAPTFTAAHRIADAAQGRSLDWSREALGQELASSYITLGAIRLTGLGPLLARQRLVGGQVGALEQSASLYAGILLGHGIEQGIGLRPAQGFDELLVDSAALFLQFQVAGALNRRAMGESWSRWENRLDLQTTALASGPVFELPLTKPAPVGPEALTPTSLQMSSRPSKEFGELRLVDRIPTAESGGPPSIPPEKLRPLPRGGVMVKTSEGWVQFGVPMWTNKDAFEIFLKADGFRLSREEIPQHLPKTYIFDLDYVAAHDGLLPADFMQYMYYVNRGIESVLVAPDAASAKRLKEFLDLSYQGPRAAALNDQVRQEYAAGAVGLPRMGDEISRGFEAAEPDVMRRIVAMNQAGEYLSGELRVLKLGPQLYEVFESGVSQGVLDLKSHPLPAPAVETLRSPELSKARRKVLQEGRPAIWPIGTGHGFTTREETSGFLLWDRGKAIAIDPPSSTIDFLARHGLPLHSLEGILLTHGHTDHYGNAVPQLLRARPDLKVYTTPTIYRMLRRQYELAIGGNPSWNFVPLYPQSFIEMIGLNVRPEYSFHPVPALGFEIYDRIDPKEGKLVLAFTGDTYADQIDLWRHTQGDAPVMSVARANQVLRHNALLFASKGQTPPPVFLIEGGIPPIHINPLRTRELLDQAEAIGVDTSRVRVYHIAKEKADEARVPKWPAGLEGFFDLSGYFRKGR